MNKYCVLKTYTIKETIDTIEDSHDRVAIVVNNTNQVIGAVSQGDIIRALSGGKNIYSRVDSIIRPDFLYLTEWDMEKANEIFYKKKITLLPIVDKNYMLQNVITLTDIYDYLKEKMGNE